MWQLYLSIKAAADSRAVGQLPQHSHPHLGFYPLPVLVSIGSTLLKLSEFQPNNDMTAEDFQAALTSLLLAAHRDGVEVHGAWDVSVDDEPFDFGVEITPVRESE